MGDRVLHDTKIGIYVVQLYLEGEFTEPIIGHVKMHKFANIFENGNREVYHMFDHMSELGQNRTFCIDLMVKEWRLVQHHKDR